MRCDPEEFRHHHTDGLDSIRHLDAGELFHRQHVRQIVHHPAQIIDAVGVGDEGVPGLALGHLFRAAMVIADVRHRVAYFLAVELQNDAEGAVRGRMIRAEVQEHEILFLVAALHAPLFGVELQRRLLFVLPRRGEQIGVEFRGARRVVLAAWMALPVARQKNPFEVRMTFEADAEQIPDFAFVPVGVGVDADDGFDRRMLPRQRDFEAHLPGILRSAALDRQQVVEEREVGLRQRFAVTAHALIHGLQIEQHAKRPRHRYLEKPQNRVALLQRHPQRRHVVLRRLRNERGLAETSVQLADDLGRRYRRSVRHASDRIRRAQCRLCLALGVFTIPLARASGCAGPPGRR